MIMIEICKVLARGYSSWVWYRLYPASSTACTLIAALCWLVMTVNMMEPQLEQFQIMNNSSQGYCAMISTAPCKMSRASIAYTWFNAPQRAMQREHSHHNNAHSKVVSLAMLATIMSLVAIV